MFERRQELKGPSLSAKTNYLWVNTTRKCIEFDDKYLLHEVFRSTEETPRDERIVTRFTVFFADCDRARDLGV